MATKERTTAPVKARTAEGAMDFIVGLPAYEQLNLFMWLVGGFKGMEAPLRWHTSVFGVAFRNHRMSSIDRELNTRQQAGQKRDQVRDKLHDAKRMRDKYLEGPRAKSTVARKRKALIRQYLAAGTKDPKDIWAVLRNDAPELAEVGVKDRPQRSSGAETRGQGLSRTAIRDTLRARLVFNAREALRLIACSGSRRAY